jgi:DUF1365 family protein
MKKLESCIYEGHVRHRRLSPVEREFDYRIFMVYLDLEEIPEVMSVHPLWSMRKRSPARFRRADYLGPREQPLRESVLDAVERKTGKRPDGPVRMLTHLRYLGVVENPVTFYYCFDRSGQELRTVLAEVTNTPWGDRHSYVIEPGDGSKRVIAGREKKAMHVSPLMPMDHEYDLRFGAPGATLPVHISSSRKGKTVFDATLNLTRTVITRPALTRLLVTYPPMSLRVIAGIYRQAAATWLRGVKYVPKGSPDPDLPNDAEPAMLCPVHGMNESTKAPNVERVA